MSRLREDDRDGGGGVGEFVFPIRFVKLGSLVCKLTLRIHVIFSGTVNAVFYIKNIVFRPRLVILFFSADF